MNCPNCEASITPMPNDPIAWCSRCGLLADVTPTGHMRRIRIPVLTQQATPAERNTVERVHPEGACR